jgi:hypothetical protein
MKKISPPIQWVMACCILLQWSCQSGHSADDFTAYFGGEVEHPTSNKVFFCKDNEVIDTLYLDCQNRFFLKFDSLVPGLYSFKHEPEYQYVYFDKNDSLMVHINTVNFDNSIVFCGRGDQKNNFLMDMYLRNERDKNSMFEVFDQPIPSFVSTIEKSYLANKHFYEKKKKEINWSDTFDNIAKASFEYQYYTKKELYPIIHEKRTGQSIKSQLPTNFYKFRSQLNCNDESLTSYSPYVMYLTHMLNNLGDVEHKKNLSDADLALKSSINKMQIADTLIKNQKVRAMLMENVAFTYLLEDQNMGNNQSFFETYKKYVTDKDSENDILDLGSAIQKMKPGLPLPDILLYDREGQKVHSSDVLTSKTVIFFWSTKSYSHMIAAHKKIMALRQRHPEYKFIAINLDRSHGEFIQELAKYKFESIPEYRCADFEDIHIKWAITKVHRTMVIDDHQLIKNAFTNLFEVDFEKNLE